MEVESLFSSTRWEILKLLANQKLSPMELAVKMNTTSANISQQLRLLELGNLVKSEKTANAEKGKPRIVYSLAGDNAFLIFLSPNFTEKKMLSVTSYHKFMMRTWFLENLEHHSIMNEFYLRIKDNLSALSNIAAVSTSKDLTIIISADTEKTLDSIKKIAADFKKAKFSFLSTPEFSKKQMDGSIVLYNHSSEGI